MSDSSPDPTVPDEPRSGGIFERPAGVILAVAATCFVLLGACVLCGGGLAVPVFLRRQAAVNAERDAVKAERAAVEARRAAINGVQATAEKNAREARDAMQERLEQEAPRAVPDDGDHATEPVKAVEPESP